MKPEYYNTFRSGLFQSPSPEVVKGWLTKYGFSRKQFGDIIGVNRREVSRYMQGERHMPYSCIRLFLIWMDELEPEKYPAGVPEGETTAPVS